MTSLLDQQNKVCAYLYNNKILLAATMEVAGVVLGDCVFGKSGEVRGKFFNNHLYSASGEIASRVAEAAQMPPFDAINVLFQGWEVVEKIATHECPWIEPQEKWLTISIAEFLTQSGTIKVMRRFTRKALF